jgi:hypothetical protein
MYLDGLQTKSRIQDKRNNALEEPKDNPMCWCSSRGPEFGSTCPFDTMDKEYNLLVIHSALLGFWWKPDDPLKKDPIDTLPRRLRREEFLGYDGKVGGGRF